MMATTFQTDFTMYIVLCISSIPWVSQFILSSLEDVVPSGYKGYWGLLHLIFGEIVFFVFIKRIETRSLLFKEEDNHSNEENDAEPQDEGDEKDDVDKHHYYTDDEEVEAHEKEDASKLDGSEDDNAHEEYDVAVVPKRHWFLSK